MARRTRAIIATLPVNTTANTIPFRVEAAIIYDRKATITMTLISTPDIPAMPSPMIRTARKNDRQPRRFVDANGDDIVQVTLKGGIIATLDGSDFDKMMGLGISDQWCRLGDGQGYSYAGVWGQGDPGKLLMVARLILDAPRGYVIRYADHNPMNLRRSNLVLATGFSKQREAGVKAGQDSGAEW